MLSGEIKRFTENEQSNWIWSEWLKEDHSRNFKYQRFTHYEFIEDAAQREKVKDSLAKLLYQYHTSSPVNTNLLAQLKYRQLASVLTSDNDQRPRDNSTRLGNLIEILACEFAKKQGYVIPVLRLQYNPNSNQSMKGDDILGFRFAGSRAETDAIVVGEGKFRNRFETQAVQEAYQGLEKKKHGYPVSMDFVATILTLKGDRQTAKKIRQIRQQLMSQSKQIHQTYLVFLGTSGSVAKSCRDVTY